MDSEYNLVFSPRTIGYALAISVVLFLALPCIAILAYVLLSLLGFAVYPIGVFVFYVAFAPFYIFVLPINFILNYCEEKLGCYSIIIMPAIVVFLIVVIGGFIRGIFEGIRELASNRPAFRRIVISIVSFWLICLALMFFFYSINFYHTNEDYGMCIRSYASSSWNSIIGVYSKYKVYIFAWTPIVITLLPAIIINGGILLYRLFRILCTGSYTAFLAVLLGIRVFFMVIYRSIYEIFYIILRTILLGIMKVVDWLLTKRKIRHICPHKDCGYVGTSSVYHCPHCGTPLINLKPSYNGIFYQRCPKCHGEVSSSCLTGRDKYAAVCPKCLNTWEYFNIEKVPDSVFIVEGASQSGKTSLLVQMLNQWHSLYFKHILFLIDNQKNTVEQLANSIKEHNFCPSTPRLSYPEAYVMHCTRPNNPFLAYFYDTGSDEGAPTSPQAGVAEPYFNMANGIFLVIDPWAEKCVFEAFNGENFTRPQEYHYSNQDANAAIGKLCSKLDHIYPGSLNAGFDIPICVVVTKCDIYGMNERMGSENRISKSSNEWDEQSQKVENYLVNIGMYNFVNVIKTRFKKYAFFAVSVLDSPNYNSNVVLNPLLWMMFNVNNYK